MALQLFHLVGVTLPTLLCTNSAEFAQRQLAAESLQQLPGGALLLTPWNGTCVTPLGANRISGLQGILSMFDCVLKVFIRIKAVVGPTATEIRRGSAGS